MSGACGRPKPKHFKHTMIADEEALVAASLLKRRQLKRTTTRRRRRRRRRPPTQLQPLLPLPPPSRGQERGKRAWRSGWGNGTVVNKSA